MGVKLTLEGVSKSWPGFQLKDIDLEIGDGEYFILLGPTGAGKTLLLETIMGYHTLDSGRILFDDKDITKTKPEDRNIGYVPQTPSLSQDMTVRENIEYGLRMKRKADKWKKAVDGIMEMMEITELEKRLALTLSGGEKRKVSLARALILEPAAILLDEPLSSIDEEKKRSLQEDLHMIHRYLDLSVIHVTHDRLEAYSMAQKMGVMNEGEIIQVGTPREIYSDPRDESVAKFIGYENIYGAKLVSQGGGCTKVDLGPHVIKAVGEPEGEDFLAVVRNDDVTLSFNYFSGMEDNPMLGTITDVLNQGAIVTVSADVGLPLKATILRRQYNQLPVEPGDRVWFTFKAGDVKLIPRQKD